MHYIQKHILDELRTVDSMRYTQLNTQDVESGHFRYHLSQLIKDGYVEQLERGLYTLTPEGQHYVDKLSAGRIHPHTMPKIITYTLLRDEDRLVLYRKPKQPYMGLLNMIGGKLHEGETAEQAAIREVIEKTGNTITNPHLAGVFELFISHDDQLQTHVIAYVHVAAVNAQEFDSTELVMVNYSDVVTLPDLAPDFLPILGSLSDTEISVKTLQITY